MRLFIITSFSPRWDEDAASRPLAAIGWGLCVKKKSSWRHLFPRKKGKKILPTSVRDGDRDRPQLRPAAPIGWQFVQNPSQTTSLTTHQQILKAYTQPPPPPPPSVCRCRTASKPDASAQHLTFRRTPLPLETQLSASAWFLSFYRPGRRWSLQSFVIFCWRTSSRQRHSHSSG